MPFEVAYEIPTIIGFQIVSHDNYILWAFKSFYIVLLSAAKRSARFKDKWQRFKDKWIPR